MMASRGYFLIISVFIVIAFIVIKGSTAYPKIDENQKDVKLLNAAEEGGKLKHKKFEHDEDPKLKFKKPKLIATRLESTNSHERKRRFTNEIELKANVITNELSSPVSNNLTKKVQHIGNNNLDTRLFQKNSTSDNSVDNFQWNQNSTEYVYPLRSNVSDYHAQRRAVMERFYARQRQIAEKYTKQVSTTPAYITEHYLRTTTEENRVPSLTVKAEERSILDENAVYNSNNNYVTTASTTEESRIRETTTEVNIFDNLRHEEILESLKNSSSLERDASDYDEFMNEDGEENDATDNEDVSMKEDILIWGKCMGKLIYQHNLLLSVHGSRIGDGNFVAELSGPICITCIKASPFGETRSTMSLDSISRGDSKNYVKLRLKGFHSDNFTYIVKIWAVERDDRNCEDIH